jgi:hypothetical protein
LNFHVYATSVSISCKPLKYSTTIEAEKQVQISIRACSSLTVDSRDRGANSRTIKTVILPKGLLFHVGKKDSPLLFLFSAFITSLGLVPFLSVESASDPAWTTYL